MPEVRCGERRRSPIGYVGPFMGRIRQPEPCLLVVAAFSRHAAALEWARERLVEQFGPIALSSPCYDFHHTNYYREDMGPDLRKVLWAFAQLVPAEQLPDIKHWTNALEEQLARHLRYVEPRPLNLDPGFLTLGKFCLATTKDQQHRIYLRDGIFAEVTLRFREGGYQPWPWTFADYREPVVLDFLRQARDIYKQQLRERASGV